MKRITGFNFAVCLPLLSFIFFTGCGLAMVDKTPHSYQPVSMPDKSFGPYSLGIAPVADQRPSANRQRMGMFLLGDFIAPIVPFADFLVYERAEKSMEFRMMYGDTNLSLLFQQDLAQEFQHAKMFDQVFPVMDPMAGTHFVLRPTLTSTKYVQRVYFYLPFVGALLMPAFGLPFTKDTYNLGMKLELYGPDRQRPLWVMNLDEKAVGYANLYWYMKGPNKNMSQERAPQVHHDLLAQGLKKAVPSLRDFLKKQPEEFWQQLPAGAASMGKPAPQEGAPGAGGLQKSLEEIMKALQEE